MVADKVEKLGGEGRGVILTCSVDDRERAIVRFSSVRLLVPGSPQNEKKVMFTLWSRGEKKVERLCFFGATYGLLVRDRGSGVPACRS